jgi:hypothetical protein
MTLPLKSTPLTLKIMFVLLDYMMLTINFMMIGAKNMVILVDRMTEEANYICLVGVV